jgi:subtilisin family serine protease
LSLSRPALYAFGVLIAVLGLILALGVFWARAPVSAADAPSTDPSPRVPKETPAASSAPTLAEFHPAIDSPRQALAHEAIWRVHGAEAEAHLSSALAAGLRLRGRIGPLGLVLLEGDPDLLRRWSADAEAAGPNLPVSLPRIPNATGLGGSAPFRDGLLPFLHLADRPEDWGRGIRIALLDTGVAAHASLESARIVLASGEPGDAHGHGTAVASLLVGSGPPVHGLAPGAELLVYPVLDASGAGNAFEVAAAIVAATDRGADLISLSAGARGDSAALREAVEYALARGVVIVASAGNDGVRVIAYPAAYEGVIAVGAIDAQSSLTDFSNTGVGLDLLAPGVGLYTASADGHYLEFSGTSAAAPIVAGVIAGLAAEDPFLSTAAAATELLARGADLGAPGADAETGRGLLDPSPVRERNNPNFADVAVSPPFLLSQGGAGDGIATLSINVQNRGTQFLARIVVHLTLGETRRTHNLSGLSSQESHPITFTVPLADLRSATGVRLAVSTELGGGQQDQRPENNQYNRLLQLEPAP